MAKALLNGINVHYQTKGEGPDVVLIHGVTSSLAVWFARVMPELSRKFRVTAYDLRGHGYSDPTPTGYTSRAMADDLVALLDHIGIERARLVGHSFGGSVALHSALLHPHRIDGVVLADAGIACLRYLRTIQDWPGWELHKDRIAKYGISYEWFLEAEAGDVRDVIRKSYEMTQPYGARKGSLVGTPRLRKLIEETSIAAEFREVAGMTEELLPKISAPLLAVYGENSPYQKMAARLTEVVPNCRCELIPNAGHFYLLEKMELFLELIADFLDDPPGYVAARPITQSASAKPALHRGSGRREEAIDSLSPIGGRGQGEGAPSPTPTTPCSRILLVAPKFDSEFAKARQFARVDVSGEAVQSLMIPLHLATVAALTPDEFEVDIWDEGVRGEIDEHTQLQRDYDLIGVTGYIAHISRAIKLAEIFHRRGLPVVIGGPGVSGAPELCRGAFDVIFLGEAEFTWPRFLSEWKQGNHRNEYRQVERPDLSASPLPRWDIIADDIKRYRLAGVQTTRGCPYDCEFCDVIHLYGRRPRHKPVARVIEEIVALRKLGAERIFICDDDFIGDKRYAKEFLKALVPVNNSFDPPLTFSTQLTIDLAQDDELMELMADGNFTQVFIGIETPRVASLVETNKVQNLRTNLVEDCRKIQSYGIAVKASMIVGFDSDDVAVIDEQIRFVEEADITLTSLNTMKAYPGTPLWVRLQRENRVVDVDDIYNEAPKIVTNIIPKGMTRVELLEGYLRLIREVRSWEGFARRMTHFLSGIKRKPNVAPPSPAIRAQRMENLMKARQALNSVSDNVRQVVTDVVVHALQCAPYMMEHVRIMMMQQAMDYALLPYHAEIVQRQIDKTLSGRLRLAPDPSAGMIPVGFLSALRSVMPMIYDRLTAGITHQSDIPEAIVALLKDFLIRWGPTFERFEDYHMVYVSELCDRHIERFNRSGGTAKNDNGRVLSRDVVQSARFLSAVLVAVEQEMRGEARSALSAQVVPLTMSGAALAPEVYSSVP